MKMMHDLWRRASRKSLRTRDAPTPAYISTKSEPLAEMNGTPASPAIERASSVLPVPGGPPTPPPPRAPERGLAGAGSPHEQEAARNPPADRGEVPGLLEEVDDLAHL